MVKQWRLGSWAIAILTLSLVVYLTPLPGASVPQPVPSLRFNAPGIVPSKLMWVERQPAAFAGGSCVNGQSLQHFPIVALVPEQEVGLTLSADPTFVIYIPSSEAGTPILAKFELSNENGDILYSTQFNVTHDSGLISFRLSTRDNFAEQGKLPELELNQDYGWDFEVQCQDPNLELRRQIRTHGVIRRVEPSPELKLALQNASLPSPEIYANAGIWHDALASLMHQLLRQPQNIQSRANLTTFLRSVGLEDMAQQLLLPCCTPETQRLLSSAITSETHSLLPIRQNGKIGYIDRTGKVVIPPKFDTNPTGAYGPLSDPNEFGFHAGLALVRVGQKFGYIDATGQLAIAAQFDDARPFHRVDRASNLALAAVSIQGQWGFIDTAGKQVVPPHYQDVRNFSEGLAQVWDGNHDGYRYIDAQGKTVINPEFVILNAGDFSDGRSLILMRQPYQWGFMDTTGKLVISLTAYDGFGDFSEGLAKIRQGNQFGFMDTTGKIAIAPQFDYIDEGFSAGLVAVKIGNKWGYADQTGKVVIPPQFDIAKPFSEGLAPVGFGYRGNECCFTHAWGYVDKTGSLVIPAQFEETAGFKNGVAVVITQNSAWSYIDKTGKVIWR